MYTKMYYESVWLQNLAPENQPRVQTTLLWQQMPPKILGIKRFKWSNLISSIEVWGREGEPTSTPYSSWYIIIYILSNMVSAGSTTRPDYNPPHLQLCKPSSLVETSTPEEKRIMVKDEQWQMVNRPTRLQGPGDCQNVLEGLDQAGCWLDLLEFFDRLMFCKARSRLRISIFKFFSIHVCKL